MKLVIFGGKRTAKKLKHKKILYVTETALWHNTTNKI